MINVTEGQNFTFEVVKQSGISFGPIPFWILPLTYAQLEARNFSLDELFPARPPSAASEGLLSTIVCVSMLNFESEYSEQIHMRSSHYYVALESEECRSAGYVCVKH